MKPFEIQTPALIKAMNAFDHVIESTKSGALENANGRNIINAGKGAVQAVGQELKVRLAAPKLNEIENKAAAAA